MTVSRSKSLSRSQKFILIGLSIFACICVLSGVGVILFNSKPISANISPTSVPLPPHFVNDSYNNGKVVNYDIVVDKSFTKDSAMKLITYYQAQHSGYNILNIIFFCDKTYAEEKYSSIDSPDSSLPDSLFYSHVLYWYQTGWPGTRFVVDVTNPDVTDYPTLGTACS